MSTGSSPHTRSPLGRLTQVASLSVARTEATYVADQSMPTACAVFPSRLAAFSGDFNHHDGEYLIQR